MELFSYRCVSEKTGMGSLNMVKKHVRSRLGVLALRRLETEVSVLVLVIQVSIFICINCTEEMKIKT